MFYLLFANKDAKSNTSKIFYFLGNQCHDFHDEKKNLWICNLVDFDNTLANIYQLMSNTNVLAGICNNGPATNSNAAAIIMIHHKYYF